MYWPLEFLEKEAVFYKSEFFVIGKEKEAAAAGKKGQVTENFFQVAILATTLYYFF
jgi:hypothetical protein